MIGRFDVVGRTGGTSAVQPDFAVMERPLRMRITTEAARASRGGAPAIASETLTLQDSSGAHVFAAQREVLESSYGESPRSP